MEWALGVAKALAVVFATLTVQYLCRWFTRRRKYAKGAICPICGNDGMFVQPHEKGLHKDYAMYYCNHCRRAFAGKRNLEKPKGD